MDSVREHCDFSCTEKMCTTLDKAGVPKDDKWRSLLIYMRGLDSHDYLSTQQKSQLQSLMLKAVHKKDYSNKSFKYILQASNKIFSAPYRKKIDDTVHESHKLLNDFQRLLKRRKGDIQELENKSVVAVAQGKDPQEIIAELRAAFRNLVQTMDQDAARLDKLSRTDGLTSMDNRRSFDQFLAQATSWSSTSGNPLSLIFLDIDFFKRFNDNYGHRIGDQALVAVAKIVGKCIKSKPDSNNLFAARYGGEEFAILLPGYHEEEAMIFAETVRQAIADYNFLIRNDNGEIVLRGVSITASFGVAELPTATPNNSAGNTLVEMADRAMYQAKANGRNRVCQHLEVKQAA